LRAFSSPLGVSSLRRSAATIAVTIGALITMQIESASIENTSVKRRTIIVERQASETATIFCILTTNSSATASDTDA
jgi:hypothetical protein